MLKKFVNGTRKFSTSRDGNVAMMFGLLLFPLVTALGLGIDFANQNYVRTQLAEAADAAGLAAARARLNDRKLSVAQAKKIARKAFDANKANINGINVDAFDLVFDDATNTYKVNLNADLDTNFIRIAGVNTLDIDVASEVTVAPPRLLEAVLVLDNTGSMEGTKLSTLKTAATNLTNSLMTDGANVKIGIVPFANYVNVGTSRRNARWLDAPKDRVETREVCRNTYPDRKETNCRTERRTCTRTNDGVTTSYPCTRRKCDVDKGEPMRKCEMKTKRQTWHGCVGSRNAPYDVRDTRYNAIPVPGLLDIKCSEEVQPLTDRKNRVIRKIQAMTASGNTYIPSGMTWGLRMISSNAPFGQGKKFEEIRNEGGVKAIILMTDGENTKSARYPLHNLGNKAAADDKTKEICTATKDKGVEVYTIAFEVNDARTKSLLENCASSRDNYFDAKNPTKLIEAFEDISNSLKDIALSA